MSWTICLYCLTVSGRYYLLQTKFGINVPYVAITTASRAEMKVHPKVRCTQLCSLLLGSSSVDVDDDTLGINVDQTNKQLAMIQDAELVAKIRADDVLRRLASLIMRPYEYPWIGDDEDDNKIAKANSKSEAMSKKIAVYFAIVAISSLVKANYGATSSLMCMASLLYLLNRYHSQKRHRMTTLLQSHAHLDLPKRLQHIWPQLLELPSIGTFRDYIPSKLDKTAYPKCEFGEIGAGLVAKLEKARLACDSPELVEVVIVDAGNNTDLLVVLSESSYWGKVQVISHQSGTGRGPTLNAGADVSKGQFLTFLHSDTLLPPSWDSKVRNCLTNKENTMCAFSFGIDRSESVGALPPGVKAVETTANWRSHMYALPYGDQVLSISSSVLQYLGGYPYQCLMEDYELVALIRNRSMQLKKKDLDEKLDIIGGDPALCSPRRWQKLGVLKVTYTNSYLVKLYNNGLDPEQLFRRYYGAETKLARSPWEIKLSSKR